MAIVHPGMKPCRNCGDYVLDNDTDLDEAEASYDDFYSDGSPYRDADVCVPCHVHELGTDGYSADDCGCTDCQINQEQDMNTTEKITDRVETYQQARGAMLTDDHTIKPGNRQDRVDRLLDHLASDAADLVQELAREQREYFTIVADWETTVDFDGETMRPDLLPVVITVQAKDQDAAYLAAGHKLGDYFGPVIEALGRTDVEVEEYFGHQGRTALLRVGAIFRGLPPLADSELCDVI